MKASLGMLAFIGCCLALGIWALTARASESPSLYPPAEGTYLDGTTSDGRWAVLWWEDGRLYNSDPFSPEAREHYDDIAWEDDWLVYRGTTHPGRRIDFWEGIRYLPRTDREWHGSSRFTSEVGDGLCVYAASIFGRFMRIDELLLWDSGDVTTWDESFEFGSDRLLRTWGGNASGADRWNITFTQVLPR